MRKVYVATVQIAVQADSEAHAADGISTLMSELVDPLFLVDWAYLRVGGQYLCPAERLIADEDDYGEGDFIYA